MNFQAEILCHPIYFFLLLHQSNEILEVCNELEMKESSTLFHQEDFMKWTNQEKRHVVQVSDSPHSPARHIFLFSRPLIHSLTVVLVTMDTGSRLAPTTSHPSVGTGRTG